MSESPKPTFSSPPGFTFIHPWHFLLLTIRPFLPEPEPDAPCPPADHVCVSNQQLAKHLAPCSHKTDKDRILQAEIWSSVKAEDWPDVEELLEVECKIIRPKKEKGKLEKAKARQARIDEIEEAVRRDSRPPPTDDRAALAARSLSDSQNLAKLRQDRKRKTHIPLPLLLKIDPFSIPRAAIHRYKYSDDDVVRYIIRLGKTKTAEMRSKLIACIDDENREGIRDKLLQEYFSPKMVTEPGEYERLADLIYEIMKSRRGVGDCAGGGQGHVEVGGLSVEGDDRREQVLQAEAHQVGISASQKELVDVDHASSEGAM